MIVRRFPAFGASRAILLALAMFLVLPLAAQTPDPAIEQAKALLGTGQAEKAVAVLEKAVAEKPNNAVRHYWLATAYGTYAESAGMFKMMSLAGKARESFEKAVKLDPGFLDARFALIELNLLMPAVMGGDVNKAREHAAEIKKRDLSAGHHAFALVAASKKDFKTAHAEYAASVRADPNSPKPHYWYGVFLMLHEKNYKASAEQFEAALRIDPEYMPALFQIGHVAALSGANLPRGEEGLKKYLGHKPAGGDPPVFRAHYWLGRVYEKLGRKAEARAQFQASLRLRPGNKDAREALKRVS